MRKSVPLLQPLFQKRNEIINLPEVQDDFWIRVFSSAPAEIDEYILPTDAAALGACLKNLTVERFEVDAQGNGEPRSLRFIFEFRQCEESPLEDTKLVKDFYWRKQSITTSKGKRRTWEGMVSDPVRIHWKKDRDLTKGLLDAVCDLFDAEKQGGDRKKLKEYEALVEKINAFEAEQEAAEEQEDDDEDMDDVSPAGVSFFSFFGYRGREVSAEDNKKATQEDDERYAKIVKGEPVDDDDEDEDDDDDEDDLNLIDSLEDVEIFEDGEELAVAMAEDLWTDAMKYYSMSTQPKRFPMRYSC